MSNKTSPVFPDDPRFIVIPKIAPKDVEAAARKLLSKQDQPHRGSDETWSRAEREELRAALNQ